MEGGLKQANKQTNTQVASSRFSVPENSQSGSLIQIVSAVAKTGVLVSFFASLDRNSYKVALRRRPLPSDAFRTRSALPLRALQILPSARPELPWHQHPLAAAPPLNHSESARVRTHTHQLDLP